VHTLTTAPPSQALRPFVRAYAQRQTGATDLVVMESCPAQLERVLQFEFGNRFDVWHSSGKHHTCDDINVVCCHTMFAGQVELRAGIDSFAVFFQPTGFSRLFEVPAAHTTNYGGIARNKASNSID
jgi:hypothetical protein